MHFPPAMSYLVCAMPFVTDAIEGTSPSAAFLVLRVAFFFAAFDLAAAFALSRSASGNQSSSGMHAAVLWSGLNVPPNELLGMPSAIEAHLLQQGLVP